MTTQLVTIQQAARNALARWLIDELAATPDGIAIQPRWFEAGRSLPPKSISVIDAGPRKVEWGDPEILAVVNNGAANVDATWSVGDVEQPVQLDVWAQSDLELDDILARLDVALNARARGLGVSNAEPVGPGLLLNLDDGWAPGTVEFVFDEPSSFSTADDVNVAEWRAMYKGTASMRLCAKATSARIARVSLKQRVSESDAATVATDTMTVTATGETYT